MPGSFRRCGGVCMSFFPKSLQSFGGGNVTPKPLEKNQKTCEYCPYQTLCRFERGRAGCVSRTLPTVKKKDYLQEEAE